MGLLGNIFGKKTDGKENAKAGKENAKDAGAEEGEGKYKAACSLCGGAGTDKKWMGQFWHKKCLRSMKKGARKMV